MGKETGESRHETLAGVWEGPLQRRALRVGPAQPPECLLDSAFHQG